MRVALGRPDGHAGSSCDLFERVAEGVLEDDHLRLLGRDARERVAELSSQLGDAYPAGRVVLDIGPELLGQRIVEARPLSLGDIAARVDHQPVQPGGELGLAAELLEPDAELRQRLLRGVARVLRVAQEMPREPLDPRRVPNAERLESASVAGFRAGHENRVAEARVVEAALAQRLPDTPPVRSSL